MAQSKPKDDQALGRRSILRSRPPEDAKKVTFKTNRGWLNRFMARYRLCVRRYTTEVQKTSAEYMYIRMMELAYQSLDRDRWTGGALRDV